MSFARPLGSAAQRNVALPFAICTFVWGSTWIVIVWQLHYVSAGWSITYRFALGALGMFAVAAARRAPLALPRRGHGFALVVGLSQFTLNYLFVYAAEGHIASGLVALVSALMIVPNALGAWALLGQAVSRRFLVGAGIAMGGIALLFADELHRASSDGTRLVAGVALSIGGLLSASTANVLQATERARALSAPTLLAWSMTYGAAFDAVAAWASAGPPRLPLDPGYLAGLLYLALVGSALTFSLYFDLIRKIGPARAGYIGVLTPVMAMALSTVFEGYRWTAGALGGALLTLAGLVVAMRARSPAR